MTENFKIKKKKSPPSPPKHLCTPQCMGYSVLQSGSSIRERGTKSLLCW